MKHWNTKDRQTWSLKYRTHAIDNRGYNRKLFFDLKIFISKRIENGVFLLDDLGVGY